MWLLVIVIMMALEKVRGEMASGGQEPDIAVKMSRGEPGRNIRIPIESMFNTSETLYPEISSDSEDVEIFKNMIKRGGQELPNTDTLLFKKMKKSKGKTKILFESKTLDGGSQLIFYTLKNGYQELEELDRISFDQKNCRMMEEETVYLEREVVICYEGRRGYLYLIDERFRRIAIRETFDFRVDEEVPDRMFFLKDGRYLDIVCYKVNHRGQIGVRYFRVKNNRMDSLGFFGRMLENFRDVENIFTMREANLCLMLGRDQEGRPRVQEIGFDFSLSLVKYGNFSMLNSSLESRIFKLGEYSLIKFDMEKDRVTMRTSIFKLMGSEGMEFTLKSSSENFTWLEDHQITSIDAPVQTEFILLGLESIKDGSKKTAILPLRNKISTNPIEIFDSSVTMIKSPDGIYLKYTENLDKSDELEWLLPVGSSIVEITLSSCGKRVEIALNDRSTPSHITKGGIILSCYDNFYHGGDKQETQYYLGTTFQTTDREEILLSAKGVLEVEGNIESVQTEDENVEIFQGSMIEDLRIFGENSTCIQSTCYQISKSEKGRLYLSARTNLFTTLEQNFEVLNFDRKIKRKFIKEGFEIKTAAAVKLDNGMVGNLIAMMSDDKIMIVLHGMEIDLIRSYPKELHGMYSVERDRSYSDDIWLVGRFNESIAFAGCKFEICRISKFSIGELNEDSLEEEWITFDRSRVTKEGSFCPKKFYGDVGSDIGFLKASCKEGDHSLFKFSFGRLEMPATVRIAQEFENSGFEVCYVPNFYVIFSVEASMIKLYSKFLFPANEESFDPAEFGITNLKNVACVDSYIVITHENNDGWDTLVFLKFGEDKFYLDKFDLVKLKENLGLLTKKNSLRVLEIGVRHLNKKVETAYLVRLEREDGKEVALVRIPFDRPLLVIKNIREGDYVFKYNATMRYNSGGKVASKNLAGIVFSKAKMKNMVKLKENFTKKKLTRGYHKLGQFVDNIDLADFWEFSSRPGSRNSIFGGLPNLPIRVQRFDELKDFYDRKILTSVKHKDLSLIAWTGDRGGNKAVLSFFMNFTTEKNSGEKFEEIHKEELDLGFSDEKFRENNFTAFGVYKDSDTEFVYTYARLDGESGKVEIRVTRFVRRDQNTRKFERSESSAFTLDIGFSVTQLGDKSITVAKWDSGDGRENIFIFLPVLSEESPGDPISSVMIQLQSEDLSLIGSEIINSGFKKTQAISTRNQLEYIHIDENEIFTTSFNFNKREFEEPRKLNIPEFRNLRSMKGKVRCIALGNHNDATSNKNIGLCIIWVEEMVINPVVIKIRQDLSFDSLVLIAVGLVKNFGIGNADLDRDNVLLFKKSPSMNGQVTNFEIKKWWDPEPTEEEINRMVVPTEDMPYSSPGGKNDSISVLIFHHSGQNYFAPVGDFLINKMLRTFSKNHDLTFKIESLVTLGAISRSLENLEVDLIFYDEGSISVNMIDLFERNRFAEVIFRLIWLIVILAICCSKRIYLRFTRSTIPKKIRKRKRKRKMK